MPCACSSCLAASQSVSRRGAARSAERGTLDVGLAHEANRNDFGDGKQLRASDSDSHQ